MAQMRAHLDDADLAAAARYERRFRHDVMAHVHAFGDQAPAARPFLHLGATSAFVTDNADLIVMRDGLRLLLGRLIAVLSALERLRRAAPRASPASPTPTSSRRSSPRSASGRRCGCRTSRSTSRSSATGSRPCACAAARARPGRRPPSWSSSAATTSKVRELERRVTAKLGFGDQFAGDRPDLPAEGGQPGARRPERDRPVGGEDGGRPPAAPARGRAARAVRVGADRFQRHGVQAKPDARRADQRARAVRDLAPGERRPHRGRAMAGAHPGRQRQPPAHAPGGVPRHRRDSGAGHQHRGRARGAGGRDPAARGWSRCRSWPPSGG